MNGFLRSILRKLGVEISRTRHSDVAILCRSLSHFGVSTVLDIGANEGQFAKELRYAGFDGTIISFEPLTLAHSRLVANAAHDNNWHVHPKVALGSNQGEATIHVSQNSVSSSFLPISHAHVAAAPESHVNSSEIVNMTTLDTVYEHWVRGDKEVVFAKVDTQGYESEVLDGGEKCLDKIHGFLLEMSLVEMYEGQELWLAIHQRLLSLGFELWNLFPEFRDYSTGRLLQLNGVFFRRTQG